MKKMLANVGNVLSAGPTLNVNMYMYLGVIYPYQKCEICAKGFVFNREILG